MNEPDAEATKGGHEELFRYQTEALNQLILLMRHDARIMELVAEMVGVAAEEVRRRPNLLFQVPSRADESDADHIIGAQLNPASVFGELLDLVKSEKEFVRGIILKLLGL